MILVADADPPFAGDLKTPERAWSREAPVLFPIFASSLAWAEGTHRLNCSRALSAENRYPEWGWKQLIQGLSELENKLGNHEVSDGGLTLVESPSHGLI